MKVRKLLLIGSFTIALAGAAYGAISIGTRFGSIVLEKVMTGNVYDLKKLRGVPYTVINSGSSKGTIQVTVMPPENSKEGYEPILDPSWLKIQPDKFEVEAGEEMPCNMILSIPDDESLAGKHYHAYIRAQTVGEDLYGAAVVNNFFFSIGTLGPEAVKNAKIKEKLLELNYDVDPEAMYLNVEAGKKIDVLKELGKSIKILNKGSKTLILKGESVGNELNYPILEGYKLAPDSNYIRTKPETIKVKSYRIQDMKLFVNIPEEHKGKKFMFVMAIHPAAEELSMVRMYVRVYVNVK